MNEKLVEKLKGAKLELDEMVNIMMEKDYTNKLIEKFRKHGIELSTDDISELTTLLNNARTSQAQLDDEALDAVTGGVSDDFLDPVRDIACDIFPFVAGCEAHKNKSKKL